MRTIFNFYPPQNARFFAFSPRNGDFKKSVKYISGFELNYIVPARLTGALESAVPEVRQASLASLEKVHGADSPEASLTALGVKHADLRKLALLRLYQRGLLHDPRAEAALRWRAPVQASRCGSFTLSTAACSSSMRKLPPMRAW